MISKLVHIQRGYIHFCSHAAAGPGVYFFKNLYKTLENWDIAWSWSKKVQTKLLWLCLLFWKAVFCFSSIWPCFLVLLLQRWGACFQSFSVGLCWKEPGCHGCSRGCILHSESPYAAPFVLHKMVCLKSCINVPLLTGWGSIILYIPLFSLNFSGFLISIYLPDFILICWYPGSRKHLQVCIILTGFKNVLLKKWVFLN